MEKHPILLLHGALGAAAQLSFISKHFQSLGHKVTTFEFSGHGNTQLQNEFSISDFATSLIQFIKTENQLGKYLVFGYSMGGYVALYASILQPNLFKGIITLATKFNWTPEIALQEIKMLNPIKIEEKIPTFAQVLDKRHKCIDWKENMLLTANLMVALGNKPLIDSASFANIKLPVLYAIGDRDEMITLDETLDAYKNSPYSALLVVPNTNHPIEKLNIELLEFFLKAFYQLEIKYPTSQIND